MCHIKCEKEQNNSEEEVGTKKCKTRLKKKHSAQIKKSQSKNKINSTGMIRTWIERKAPGKAQDRNNEKQPYNVPIPIEPERRRAKKEPEKKHRKKKKAANPSSKNKTIKNNSSVDKGRKQN